MAEFKAGWTRLKELRNILVFVHPLFGTSGKIFVFVRHVALKCLSFRVVKLLRPLSRFLRSEAPMSRISQKVGHSRHSGDIHTGGGGYERHIQRQSRPQKRPIRRSLFPWICFPETRRQRGSSSLVPSDPVSSHHRCVNSVADFKKQWGVNPATGRKREATAMVSQRW